MKARGYRTVSRLRCRSLEARGGQDKHADTFDRNGRTLATFSDEYLEWLRIHNRTEDAVQSRAYELKVFLCWSEERSLTLPAQITRSILESYQRFLWNYRKKNGNPLGLTTQSSRLNGIKQFFSWLCRQRVLEANPASELELPKPGKRLPVEALTISETETVLSTPDISDPLGIRDRAMLELFYSTGIRRMELTNLHIEDLNMEKKLLQIRQGKGQKDRVVPVGTRALMWLEKYLDDTRPLLALSSDERGFFLTGYGTPFNSDVLSRLVAEYIQKAQIGKRGSCHLFRHTCATHLLEGGADIRYIQQLLGHEKLETTAIYTEVSIIQLQAVHTRCHPAERNETPETEAKSSSS
jgi:integrase/recombinase XerD